MKTSYKTRGKKERHESLFPDLVREIEQDKAARKTEQQWPDQESEAYKKEATRVAEPLLGAQLTARQKTRFLLRVVAGFSACFWMPGCVPPRVKGFQADIRPKPDAVPKVTQQFPLPPL